MFREDVDRIVKELLEEKWEGKDKKDFYEKFGGKYSRDQIERIRVRYSYLKKQSEGER